MTLPFTDWPCHRANAQSTAVKGLGTSVNPTQNQHNEDVRT